MPLQVLKEKTGYQYGGQGTGANERIINSKGYVAGSSTGEGKMWQSHVFFGNERLT